MSATKIAQPDARRTETPNALMTTLASPTQGGTQTLSLWRVSMNPGQSGPLHVFDVEQVWHVLEGAATIVVGTESIELSVGDTLVIPAGAPRQIRTGAGAGFVVSGPASGQATTPDGADSVSPPWIV
ncbi:cupin domain-containing protein [Nocardioides luteus]|uniref:Cupin n=1 Tax=Nocardioides luteus TaxID=1844 RepID=A0A1J4MYN7_9ACTN|nr:cupin domain-containing protein [Nocardioides luteus]OIJ24395.1 cupin [Nocardioides luteus]